MASPPASTKTSLGQRLRERARQRWPQLAGIGVRFRGQFAYVTGKLPDGSELPLCRLRYGGYASTWGFAIYRASHDDYQDSFLPSGQPAGTPEEALDCACGLYLGDPTAWLTPPGTDTPTDLQAGALASDSQGAAGGDHRLLRAVRGHLGDTAWAGSMDRIDRRHELQIRWSRQSSRTVRCGLCAGPTFHSCPPGTGVVQRLGSSIGSSRGGTALILDCLLFRPDISPVATHRASVMRCRRSLPLAVG